MKHTCQNCKYFCEFDKETKDSLLENRSYAEKDNNSPVYDGDCSFNLISADPGQGVYKDEGEDCDGWKENNVSRWS